MELSKDEAYSNRDMIDLFSFSQLFHTLVYEIYLTCAYINVTQHAYYRGLEPQLHHSRNNQTLLQLQTIQHQRVRDQ